MYLDLVMDPSNCGMEYPISALLQLLKLTTGPLLDP